MRKKKLWKEVKTTARTTLKRLASQNRVTNLYKARQRKRQDLPSSLAIVLAGEGIWKSWHRHWHWYHPGYRPGHKIPLHSLILYWVMRDSASHDEHWLHPGNRFQELNCNTFFIPLLTGDGIWKWWQRHCQRFHPGSSQRHTNSFLC